MQHHVQSILVREKALLRMFPDELHQPACHIMLPPIAHIDQQHPRVKIRRAIHPNPVLQGYVISLLILHHRARITFYVRLPKFLQRIVYQNIAIHIKHLLLVRKQIRQKKTVINGFPEPVADFQTLHNPRLNDLDRQQPTISGSNLFHIYLWQSLRYHINVARNLPVVFKNRNHTRTASHHIISIRTQSYLYHSTIFFALIKSFTVLSEIPPSSAMNTCGTLSPSYVSETSLQTSCSIPSTSTNVYKQNAVQSNP